MSRKICVITGTRAEYGLLRLLMQGIRDDEHLNLQTAVTGTHFLPEFGSTYRAIEEDGFRIDRRIDMLLCSDSAAAIGKSVGLGAIGFADAFADMQPDLLVVLGDRFEILSAVTAALFARIPVMHLHGGELTQGALDDSIRHAITKMSHVHCVATELYRHRVIQLGEQPDRVHCVGGLGVDLIKQTRLLGRADLEAVLDFKLKERNLLVTFHPATSEDESPASQMQELLAALEELDNTGLIFTLPNADSGGRELIAMLHAFVEKQPNARAYASLGQLPYFSCILHCDGVVGNSSSGLLEAPTLKKGVINIGDRQRGRLMASSVINCRAAHHEIGVAIKTLYSPKFRANLESVSNPYGDGGASARILELIKELDYEDILKKVFYDLPSTGSHSVGGLS